MSNRDAISLTGRSTLGKAWALAKPYWWSEERWSARLLLAANVAFVLFMVYLLKLFNNWHNDFYNALQERNYDVFAYQLGYFCVLAAIYIALKVYQLHLNQWLQIRWRRFMVDRYLGGHAKARLGVPVEQADAVPHRHLSLVNSVE